MHHTGKKKTFFGHPGKIEQWVTQRSQRRLNTVQTCPLRLAAVIWKICADGYLAF